MSDIVNKLKTGKNRVGVALHHIPQIRVKLFSEMYLTVTVLFLLSYSSNPRYEISCYLPIYITIMFNNVCV